MLESEYVNIGTEENLGKSYFSYGWSLGMCEQRDRAGPRKVRATFIMAEGLAM
jgi:hypothetical protein